MNRGVKTRLYPQLTMAVFLPNRGKDLWTARNSLRKSNHHSSYCFPLPDGARRSVLGGRDGRDAGRATALPHGEEDGLPAAGGQNQKVGVTPHSFSKQETTIQLLNDIINIGD